MRLRNSGVEGGYFAPAATGLLRRRSLLLIIPTLLVAVLIVGLLPRAEAKATTVYNGYSMSPLGQVTSTNVGTCMSSLTAVVTAPNVDKASAMRDNINSMGSFGIFQKGVQTVSTRVTAVSGGGTELQLVTDITFDCDLFKNGGDWKKNLEGAGVGILSGIVGGATYHLVNALVLGILGDVNRQPPPGINWRAKIAGCLSGAASGAVTLLIATATGDLPSLPVITGNAIGSCLGGSVLTGFDPKNTWNLIAGLFHNMHNTAPNQILPQDVVDAAAQQHVDIERAVGEVFQEEESAVQQCATDPNPNPNQGNPCA